MVILNPIQDLILKQWIPDQAGNDMLNLLVNNKIHIIYKMIVSAILLAQRV